METHCIGTPTGSSGAKDLGARHNSAPLGRALKTGLLPCSLTESYRVKAEDRTYVKAMEFRHY